MFYEVTGWMRKGAYVFWSFRFSGEGWHMFYEVRGLVGEGGIFF